MGEFKELKLNSLIDDVSSSSSTEFWLIQHPLCPDKTNTSCPKLGDFDGQETTLKLKSDTDFGSLQSSSGKSYELRSGQSNRPDKLVFLPSASETKIVGKISRYVCLIHYPEPSEFQKLDSDFARTLGQGSSATSSTGSSRHRSASPTRIIRRIRHIQDSTSTTSNPSSGKSHSDSEHVITGSLDSPKSKSRKRKHSNDGGSLGHFDRDYIWF